MPGVMTNDRSRWIVVGAATLGMAAGFGGMTTVSLLIAPLEGEFNVLRSEMSLAYTLLTLGVACGGLVVGRLTDRISTRPITVGGAVIVALSFLLISMQDDVRSIQAIYLTAGFFGFSCLYSPLLTTVSLWFPARSGLALGLVTAGGTIGQAVIPPIFQALSADVGWRGACILLALGYAGLVAPALSLVRKPAAVPGKPSATGPVDGWPLPPVLSVGLISAAALFCCFLMATPMVHLIPLAMQNGASASQASALMAVMMTAGCGGRVLAGLVADRFGALATYALVSALQTIAVCLFIQPGPQWMLFISALAFGLGFGGVMTAMVCTIRTAVPSARLGRAMSVVGLLAWLGMGAGGFQGGLCFDLTGSYSLSFAAAALAGAANVGVLGLIALLLKRAERTSNTSFNYRFVEGRYA